MCRGTGNLLPAYQQYLLRALRHSNMFIVVPTDKNFGPAVLEMTTYIRRAYSDHLSDATTYRQMTPLISSLPSGKSATTLMTSFANMPMPSPKVMPPTSVAKSPPYQAEGTLSSNT
jgi:hypothetical protein